MGERKGKADEGSAEDEISFALLAALVENSNVEKDGAAVTEISFFA